MNPTKPKTPRSSTGYMLAGLLAVTSLVSAQNLVLDGGFEFGQEADTFNQATSYGAWSSPSGTTALLGMPYAAVPPLEGGNAMYIGYAEVIRQTFATEIGRQYQVGVSTNCLDGSASSGTLRIYNSSGTDLTASISCPGGKAWKPREFTFTASGTPTTIELQGADSSPTIIDAVSVTRNPPGEFTVFGTGERVPLSTNYNTSDIIKKYRKSVLPSFFNHETRDTYSGSVISSGTVTIEEGDPNGIFELYNARNDIKELEIMAETLVIRSPWLLRQTKVTIYARNLRFEADGSITTTGLENPIPAADATSEALPGGDGSDGVAGGSADVFVGTFTTSGYHTPLVLTGGKGQNAGKGKHGQDGTSLSVYWGPGVVFSYGDARYTVPDGWSVTGEKFPDGSWGNGVGTWPGNGENAWRSGTPGRGGDGGALRTNHASVWGLCGGGAAGDRGVPTIVSGHSSTTMCEGGNAGIPVNAIQIYCWESGIFNQNEHISEKERHTSVAGASYPVPVNDAGTAGSQTVTGSAYSWLNPQLLRKILNDAKDDYLQNRISRVQTRLQDYSDVLTQFRADAAAWSGTPLMSQLELGQMYDEIQILLQQIANGLDYFGNPAGWVPMLSFEVASNIFDQEIDRSLDIIYLTKWIGTKQDDAAERARALTTARDLLADEVADAQSKYATAAANLANFQSEAQALEEKVNNILVQLEVKDNSLHQKAVQNLRPPEWEMGVRAFLKGAGLACKMIPVYQPVLGGVGDALNLGSDFDPDDPWTTISAGLDLTTGYLNSGIQNAANSQTTVTNTASLDPTQLKAFNAGAARISALTSMSNASSALSGGIADFRNLLEQSRAPRGDVDKEIEKLRAADPEYGALAQQIQDLMASKQDFADRIVKAIRNVADLSDLMTRNILAMDGLSVETGANLDIIDARVNSYLKDMERRAFDRLLKYHYYMAKAYEFRLVTPYTAQLNLEDLFNQMLGIAQAPTNAESQGVLSGDDRNLLKGIFKNLIATTTQKIIDDYSVSGSTPGSSLNYDLTPGDIAALNRGEAITLNLANRGLFLPTEEDIRIADVHVNGVAGIGTTGTYASPSYVALWIEHSGLSNIKKDGRIYQFRHYNQSTRSAITWESRYDPLGITMLMPPLVPASSSLLRSLLPALNSDQLLLYARPSAWADLKIWRAGNNGGTTFGLGDPNAPITLTHVTLHVEFDRSVRVPAPQRRSVELLAARTTDKAVPTLDDEDDRMKPAFTVSSGDRNGRLNAVGRFVRIYNSGSPATVQVTAPAIYGDKVFWKWKENGFDVAGAAGTNPTISVATTGDHRLVAYYATAPDYFHWASTNIPAGADPSFDGDWDHDGILNGIAYVFGGTRIHARGGAAGVGRIAAPLSIPADVDLYLERSSDLDSWQDIVSWVNLAAPAFTDPGSTSIVNGEVIDHGNVGKFFYRYRVVRR